MARRKSTNLFGGGVRVDIDEAGISQFMETNKAVRDLLVGTASAVAQEAQATASSAEEGSGGRIDGYADAGFTVQWQSRGGIRPRVNVVSNAPIDTFLAAYFHTLKRDGVDHLRAALRKFTR